MVSRDELLFRSTVLVHDSNRNGAIKLYSTLACFIPANARTLPAEKAENIAFLFAEKA